MRRIRISLDKEEVQALFERARNFKKRNIDNAMVLMDFKLAYYCALKTGELLLLRIRDVFDETDEVRDHLDLKGRGIPIPDILKPDLKAYRDRLRAKRYPAGKNAYLFPIIKSGTGGREKSSYVARVRKWHRDINEVANELDNVHEKIRQVGIREYFNQLDSSLGEKDRLRKTAKFAGCSEKWLEIILASEKRKQESVKTGQNASQFVELRRKASELETLQISEEELRHLARDILSQAKSTLSESFRYAILHKIEKVFSKKGFRLNP